MSILMLYVLLIGFIFIIEGGSWSTMASDWSKYLVGHLKVMDFLCLWFGYETVKGHSNFEAPLRVPHIR